MKKAAGGRGRVISVLSNLLHLLQDQRGATAIKSFNGSYGRFFMNAALYACALVFTSRVYPSGNDFVTSAGAVMAQRRDGSRLSRAGSTNQRALD
jgi:hypothetical protein